MKDGVWTENCCSDPAIISLLLRFLLLFSSLSLFFFLKDSFVDIITGSGHQPSKMTAFKSSDFYLEVQVKTQPWFFLFFLSCFIVPALLNRATETLKRTHGQGQANLWLLLGAQSHPRRLAREKVGIHDKVLRRLQPADNTISISSVTGWIFQKRCCNILPLLWAWQMDYCACCCYLFPKLLSTPTAWPVHDTPARALMFSLDCISTKIGLFFSIFSPPS